jgi:hypothetical protein
MPEGVSPCYALSLGASRIVSKIEKTEWIGPLAHLAWGVSGGTLILSSGMSGLLAVPLGVLWIAAPGIVYYLVLCFHKYGDILSLPSLRMSAIVLPQEDCQDAQKEPVHDPALTTGTRDPREPLAQIYVAIFRGIAGQDHSLRCRGSPQRRDRRRALRRARCGEPVAQAVLP